MTARLIALGIHCWGALRMAKLVALRMIYLLSAMRIPKLVSLTLSIHERGTLMAELTAWIVHSHWRHGSTLWMAKLTALIEHSRWRPGSNL